MIEALDAIGRSAKRKSGAANGSRVRDDRDSDRREEHIRRDDLFDDVFRICRIRWGSENVKRFFSTAPFSALALEFLIALAERPRIQAWARGGPARSSGEAEQRNALEISRVLGFELERPSAVAAEARSFEELDFSGQDFSGHDLRAANLRRVRAVGAKFVRANLADADLTGADLSGADLTWADPSGAKIDFAKLRGAKLRGAAVSAETRIMGSDLIAVDRDDALVQRATVFGSAIDRARLVDTFGAPSAPTGAVAMSSAGLIAIAAGTTVVVWNLATQRPVRFLEGHKSPVVSVAFSHDSQLLPRVSEDY